MIRTRFVKETPWLQLGHALESRGIKKRVSVGGGIPLLVGKGKIPVVTPVSRHLKISGRSSLFQKKFSNIFSKKFRPSPVALSPSPATVSPASLFFHIGRDRRRVAGVPSGHPPEGQTGDGMTGEGLEGGG